MPQMHDALAPAGTAGTQIHRCLKGHPLNPMSLAAWQEGAGIPVSQSYAHVRKCKICKLEIPRNWVRLGCSKGCLESICYHLNCSAKALDAAKKELQRINRCTPATLEAVLLEEESLLLKEAAIDLLRELGNPARACAPALEKILLQEVNHMKDHLYGSPQSRNSIRHTFLANDGTHPLQEYQGLRALRVKAASTLASLGELRVLEDVLFGEDPASGRSEVIEASILGLAELGVQKRGTEAAHLAERVGQALFDECETIRIAAAHTLRALGPAGPMVLEPATQCLVEALQDQNKVTGPEKFGGMPIRHWRDAEGRRLFELDVVAALGYLGRSAPDAADPRTEPLAARLAGTRTSHTMRWAAADALKKSGALDELRKASDHPQLSGTADLLANHPKPQPQSAAVVEEIRRAAALTLDSTVVKKKVCRASIWGGPVKEKAVGHVN